MMPLPLTAKTWSEQSGSCREIQMSFNYITKWPARILYLLDEARKEIFSRPKFFCQSSFTSFAMQEARHGYSRALIDSWIDSLLEAVRMPIAFRRFGRHPNFAQEQVARALENSLK
jgi:hypothetical protein